jgi:Domain of unknown function (DUF5655)
VKITVTPSYRGLLSMERMMKRATRLSRVTAPTVRQHFVGRDPIVRAIYDRIISAAEAIGPTEQDPKKTSIHLNPHPSAQRTRAGDPGRRSAFAGIATRKDALILTLKAETDIGSPRIFKREQASASRWYLYLRLEDPSQVDQELTAWLKQSFDLSD